MSWSHSRLPAVASLLLGLLPAQEPKPSPSSPVDAALSRLREAKGDDRAAALAAYMQAQIDTSALYAGQYSALTDGGEDTVALLSKWSLEAPDKVGNEDNFRQACVRALRDVCGEKAPDEVMSMLRGMLQDEFETGALKEAAAYALAQFGDRTAVDKMIEQVEPDTKGDDVKRKAAAWGQLADIQYNLRAYDKAAEAYSAMLALHEAGEIDLAKANVQVPTLYYNAACSLALAGKKDEAFAKLTRALEIGAKSTHGLPKSLLETDMDIASLRADPRFEELIVKHYAPAKAADAPKKPPAEKEKKSDG